MSEPRRFMINSCNIANGQAVCDAQLHHHIINVLRLRVDDRIMLVDEHGTTYQGKIQQIDKGQTTVKLLTSATATAKNGNLPRIALLQGMAKSDKTELILQKCTELGVSDLHLFRASRSVVQIDETKLQKRMERWQRIVTEAARQSERFDLPLVHWHPTTADAADMTDNFDLKLLLWERGEYTNLREQLPNLPKPTSIVMAVGPEGGFTKEEVELFVAAGFMPTTLGKRILRTETTAFVMTTILQYIWGDI